MGYRYPQPDNEDAFEQFCLRYYRRLLKRDALERYGKRGEKQDGVDIFDPLCHKPIIAIQSKHHEDTKTLRPAVIRAEVKKAEGSVLQIERYIIATTARKSREAQNTVVELNTRPDDARKFSVELHFWDDMCERMEEFGEAHAEIIVYGKSVLAGVSAMISTNVMFYHPITPSLSEGTPQPNDVFAQIENHLSKRQVEVAKHELQKLPTPDASAALPDDQRYKLFRLHAKVALETNDFETACRLFLEAYAICPNLEQAQVNRVLAHVLNRNLEEARRIAVEYMEAEINSPALAVHFVSSCSTSEQLEEHRSYLEQFVKNDANLNVALSHKYRELERRTDARSAAVLAVDQNCHSAQAQFALALSAHHDFIRGDARVRGDNLQLAFTSYDRALGLAESQFETELIPEILVNRATAKALSGDRGGAAEDYRRAVQSHPDPNLYANAAVSNFLHDEDYESAFKLLDSLDLSTQYARYLDTCTRFHFATPSEKYVYITRMSELAEEEWERAIECRFFCVQWAINIADLELAESFASEAFLAAQPFCGLTLRAWIHIESDRLDVGRAEVKAALNESVKATNPQILSVFAKLLVSLGDDENAIVFLEQATMPGVFDVEMRRLIDCANRLKRHDLLLRIYKELREVGVKDKRARKGEVQLLEHYDPEKAFELSCVYAEDSLAPAYFVAYRNVLAIRLKKPIEMEFRKDKLPSGDQLLPAEARLMLFPFTMHGRYEQAIDFLYDQLRAHFENSTAHSNYVFFFLQAEDHAKILESPKQVCVDTAVQIEVKGDRRWFTIEDAAPLASRREFASTHDFAAAFLGKVVGDEVELPGNEMQPETGVVIDVQTKYLRLFQDCISQYRIRFPDSPVLQQMSCGEGEDFDPQPFIDTLKKRRDYVDECMRLYVENAMPISLLADRVGVSERIAIKALTSLPNGFVRCSVASPTELHRLAVQHDSGRVIVLDISAIVTLSHLDGWGALPTNRMFLVSRRTAELVDAWLLEAETSQGVSQGYARLADDGRIDIAETTADQRAESITELRRIKDNISRRCQLRSSVSLADMSPKKRESYVETLGFHNVESMSVASDENAYLWSDDCFQSFVARADFGVSSLWTQLAFRCLANNKFVTEDEFHLVTAKLLGWSYVNTIWNAETLIAAGTNTQWDVSLWPFRQCLSALSKSQLPIAVRSKIAGEFIKLLRRSTCIELRQSAVIQAILNSLGDAAAIRSIYQRMDRIFLVDFVSAEFVRHEIAYWLRLR